MACRHEDPINNTRCSSYRTPEEQVEDAKESIEELKTRFKISDTPDNSKFEIMRVNEVGDFLVMEVKYESCDKCAYEGQKIMVFHGKTIDALKWRVIDPHFRDPASSRSHKTAPSPLARFPANAEGWKDAMTYAATKAIKTNAKNNK